MLIIEVAYNLTFLVAFAVISGLLDNRYSAHTLKGSILQGVLFGLAAVIGMLNPFELYTGLFFDGRSVAISLATLFFGPIAGLIATIMAISLRLYIGGVGLLIGVLISLIAFAGGYSFRLMWNRAHTPSMRYLFYLGLAIHVIMALLLFLLPEEIRFDAFLRTSPTILIFYPIATVLMGKILSGQLEIRYLLHKVRESEEKFRAIFNSTNEAIFVHDAETGMIVDFNDRTLDLYKLDTREQVLNNFVRNISSGDDNYNPQKGMEYIKKAVELGSYTFDWLAKKGTNELFWVEVSLSYIEIAEKGHVIAVVRNIDDRKKQEEITKKNLREKEVLLAEIHHRVKNNLAIISSLISLQLDTVSDRDAREILDETDKRIRSISLVHELVYKNEQLESVDFGKFLQELIPVLGTFSNQQNKAVEIQIDADPIQIELNKSVPCALIATEIITNCYKHAFRNRDSGNIEVSLKKAEDKIVLMIQDDGNGVADLEKVKHGDSFGYTIMTGLTQQIGGKIGFENTNPGLRVTLTF